MNGKWLWVMLLLSMTACAQKTPRCDGPLRPINLPSSSDTAKSP